MEIVNNQLQVAKLKLAYIVSFVVGLILLGFALSRAILSLEHYIVLLVAILLLGYLVYLIIIKPEYIYFAEEKNKILIKTYPARPIFRNYKAFEINLNALHHFEIRQSYFNLKVDLTLWIKTSKGVGNYPPLSLSALSKNEQKKLSKYLSKHSIEKQKNIIPF